MAPLAARVDRPRGGVRTLTSGRADLHAHSTASDGIEPPEAVVARAGAAGLAVLALTDHDTLAGIPAAQEAGTRLGVRVVAGCEFSVAAPWGEMHLLGYFLAPGAVPLEALLQRQRDDRARRAAAMVDRLRAHDLPVTLEQVHVLAAGGAIGRPHVARALLEAGVVTTMDEAFERWLRHGRPGFMPKTLPTLAEVSGVVHALGGVVSAAHLRERGTRSALARMLEQGLDAVEVRHPAHPAELQARLAATAAALGLGCTGGSDWHGGDAASTHAPLGSHAVPLAWLEDLESRRPTPATS